MEIVRCKVIWIGDKPDTALALEFKLRDHELVHWTYEDFDTEPTERRLGAICEAKAVYYIHNPEKQSRTIKFVRLVTTLPVSYSGMLPHVVLMNVGETPAVRGIPEIKAALEKTDVPFIRLPAKSDFPETAQSIARQFPGRHPNLQLQIKGERNCLTDEKIVLLQRSFSDYQSISVVKMPSGFSATVIKVFAEKVFAEREDQSKHAVPFVAKFDNHDNIKRELNNYKDYINHFVPFYLRPDIDLSRCFIAPTCAPTCGIIVASFVDHSVTLLQAINLGLGSAALHSLFEETLGLWHHNSSPKEDILYLFLQKGNSSDRVILERFADNKTLNAAKNIALLMDPETLLMDPETLLGTIKKLPCARFLYGTSHKDLHAKNILVRGSDAVVIDFSRCDKGPILLDVATLDVSIFFDSAPTPPKCGDRSKEHQSALEEEFRNKLDEWQTVVCDVFSHETVLEVPPQKVRYEPFARHWASVRQLRRLALLDQRDKMEYGICVSIELFRRAMFPDNNPTVAGYAYYLADRLTKSLIENCVSE